MGSEKYKELLRERKECFIYLREQLELLGQKTNERPLLTSNNSISIGFSLTNNSGETCKEITQIGSMLFTRNVTGVRVVTPGDDKEMCEGLIFKNFNSHSNSYPCAYFTAAAAIGIKKNEVDTFIKRLHKVLDSVKNEKSEK